MAENPWNFKKISNLAYGTSNDELLLKLLILLGQPNSIIFHADTECMDAFVYAFYRFSPTVIDSDGMRQIFQTATKEQLDVLYSKLYERKQICEVGSRKFYAHDYIRKAWSYRPKYYRNALMDDKYE